MMLAGNGAGRVPYTACIISGLHYVTAKTEMHGNMKKVKSLVCVSYG